MKSTLQSNRVKRNIGLFLTITFGVFSLFGLLASATSVDQGVDILLGSILLFGSPFAIGLYLFFSSSSSIKKMLKNDIENTILDLAEKNKGILTQAFLAKNTTLTLAECGNLLNEMTIKGIAQVDVDNNGVIEYHFNSLKNNLN